MVGRSQARLFIIESAEEIKQLHKKGYTLKEIHRLIPNLKENIHYATFHRNIPTLGIIEVKTRSKQSKKGESTKNENFVNENHVTEKDDKLSENAKRNLEKLTNRKPKFSYDHSTKGKDFYWLRK